VPGKNPKNNRNAKSQLHVQSALWMRTHNAAVQVGDVIPYIFSSADARDGSSCGVFGYVSLLFMMYRLFLTCSYITEADEHCFSALESQIPDSKPL
jgi:hypothetical protein